MIHRRAFCHGGVLAATGAITKSVTPADNKAMRLVTGSDHAGFPRTVLQWQERTEYISIQRSGCTLDRQMPSHGTYGKPISGGHRNHAVCGAFLSGRTSVFWPVHRRIPCHAAPDPVRAALELSGVGNLQTKGTCMVDQPVLHDPGISLVPGQCA